MFGLLKTLLKTTPTQAFPLDSLHKDILGIALDHSSIKTLGRTARINKRWKTLSNEALKLKATHLGWNEKTNPLSYQLYLKSIYSELEKYFTPEPKQIRSTLPLPPFPPRRHPREVWEKKAGSEWKRLATDDTLSKNYPLLFLMVKAKSERILADRKKAQMDKMDQMDEAK